MNTAEASKVADKLVQKISRATDVSASNEIEILIASLETLMRAIEIATCVNERNRHVSTH